MAASDERRATAPAFQIDRVFKAPIGRVWAAWSEPGQFVRWWGPKGCTIDCRSLDFRPGGFFHYAMRFAGAETMWGRFLYREIAARQRIVWLNSFSNEAGGIARAPFSDLCPLEIENTVNFTAQGDATTVRLDARPFGASPPELGYFAELLDAGSLAQGYGGTFDQLEAQLLC